MSYRNQYEKDSALEAARVENAKKDCIAAVYASRQDFIRCEANDRAILELILSWTQNPDVLPTKAIFDEALLEAPERINRFACQSLDRTREQLIEEILSLLASKNGGRDGKFDSFNLRSEEKRMVSWSLDALRIRLAEIKTKQHMSTVPVSVLKSFVADAHADKSPFPGWPTLPLRMVPPGQIHAVDIDADYLNGLVKTDLWLFKRFVKIYGDKQIDSRRGIK